MESRDREQTTARAREAEIEEGRKSHKIQAGEEVMEMGAAGSAFQHRQIEQVQALGVGDHIDLHDLPPAIVTLSTLDNRPPARWPGKLTGISGIPDAGNRSEALSAYLTPCSARYSTSRRGRPWEPYIGSWDVHTCLCRPWRDTSAPLYAPQAGITSSSGASSIPGRR
jgi:hypothetical protein